MEFQLKLILFSCFISTIIGSSKCNTSVSSDSFANFVPTTSTAEAQALLQAKNLFICPRNPNITEGTAIIPHVTPSSSTRCGEVFSCASGGIFYKINEPVLPFERCTWTIAVPKATGYEASIFYYGYPPRQNNLLGYGLVISDFGLSTDRLSRAPNHFVPTTTETKTFTNTTMLLITFHTGERTWGHHGFILQFKALFGPEFGREASQQSEHRMITSEEYYTKFPLARTYYTMTELSSFVFTPENNFYDEGKENRVVFLANSLPNCNYAWVNVYLFNSTCVGANKWEYQGRMCANSPAFELIKSSDTILFIFESINSGGYNAGFHLTYSTGLKSN